ncbi:hypothetical protein [Maledivibacter halophilus]|nr:hypothetical protein [Maledivibacter halophilus]
MKQRVRKRRELSNTGIYHIMIRGNENKKKIILTEKAARGFIDRFLNKNNLKLVGELCKI